MERFHVPQEITSMFKQYISDILLRFSISTFTKEWTDLQVVIATGCTISLILFAVTM